MTVDTHAKALRLAVHALRFYAESIEETTGNREYALDYWDALNIIKEDLLPNEENEES